MENNSQEALLEEAKRRYPIGTRFKPAHIPSSESDWFEITGNVWSTSSGYIWNHSFKTSTSENIRSSWEPTIYMDGKWAEILEEKPKSLIGRWVKALVDNPVSGSGVKAGEYGKFISENDVDFPHFKSYSCNIQTITLYKGTKLELMPEGFEPPSEKIEYGEPTDEFDFDDWEPSTETCKNCADRFYDGYVNTGQHNLCEGRHCRDMRESEEEELLGENKLTEVVNRWNLDKTKIYKITKEEYEQAIEDGIVTTGFVYTSTWNKIEYWLGGWNLTDIEPQKGLYNLDGSLCDGEIKDINKDLQWKPSIEEHSIVPLTSEKYISLLPQEVIPTLSKNKRKKYALS